MICMAIAQTPDPPCYVAVITLERTDSDDGYLEMFDAMFELAHAQPGFLGMEWVCDSGQRTGITSPYWADADAIAARGSSTPTTWSRSAWDRNTGTGPAPSGSPGWSVSTGGQLESWSRVRRSGPPRPSRVPIVDLPPPVVIRFELEHSGQG